MKETLNRIHKVLGLRAIALIRRLEKARKLNRKG